MGGASRDRAAFGEGRDAVFDRDGKRAENVVAVGHSRRGHRVGDEHDVPVGDEIEGIPHSVGGGVDAVGDELGDDRADGGLVDRGECRAGIAVVDGAHRVEQVGGGWFRGTGDRADACELLVCLLDCGDHLFTRAVRVAIAREGSVRDQGPGHAAIEVRFGGDRHRRDRAVSRFKERESARGVPLSDELGVVSALAGVGDERALEVDSRQFAGLDEGP